MRAGISLCALAAGLALAGCSGGGDSTDGDGSGSTATVEIVEFAYAPETVAVDAGTEINWANSDGAPHTATADDGSFDTGTLKRDDEAAVSLDEPGTYTYYCRFHAFMNGTIEVE